MALGLVLTGCDSTGMNGEDEDALNAPTNLSISTSDGAVELSWAPVNVENLEGYNVYRSDSPIDDVSGITSQNDTPLSDTVYTDQEVTNGTTYYYAVTTVDQSGNESTPTEGVEATPFAYEYPSSTYGEETVANLLAFDLGVRVGSAGENSEDALLNRYTGNINDVTIRAAQGLTTEGQSVYGDIDGDVNLSSMVSTMDLMRSDQLESPDSPNAGSSITTDELLRFYFGQAGSENVTITNNGIVLSQFAEKMLLGTPIYGKGAAILSDFANGDITSNRAAQWDAAFGYFGFPRTLEPFVDYSAGGEALAEGPAQDIDGNNSVDLTSEYVHTWAAYAIERSAAAENNGNANDFARRAFDALVEGRNEIANENYENLADRAETVLRAWEATVAVNVIHYVNSMQSNLEGVSGEVSEGDVGQDAWGEAKAFAWGLQFHSDQLTDDQLNSILEDIGNDPPYGEMSASEYSSDLADAKQIIEDAYGFNASNVDAW